MIISKTPFRISLFGGGTDYPEWYKYNKGKVVSFAINKYCYINFRELPPFFNYNYRIKYHKIEYCKKISSIKHPSVRECFRKFNIQNADLTHSADLPAFSGLGSSSTFTVGLLKVINTFKKKIHTKNKLFKQAIEIERKILKEPVGCQDQTSAAMGGFNVINFKKNGIKINSLNHYVRNIEKIREHLLLVYTGLPRISFEITKNVILNIPKKKKVFEEIYNIAAEAEKIIKSQNFEIDHLSSLLNETWKLKKKTSKKITNNTINEIFQRGMENGAEAGKLLGGGGGGFILFIVKPQNKKKILNKFKNLKYIPLDYDNTGSIILQRE